MRVTLFSRSFWLGRVSGLTLETLLVFLVTFAGLLSMRGLALITIFQERDLERARQVARGQWFFYGPELSGGGHLPGAFYYYLNAIPMWLGLEWEGCWQLILLFGAAGFALTWWGFRRFLSLEAALAGAATLLCMPQFVKTFVYFQNFSLMPLFLIIALLGYAAAFAFETPRARLGWICACVALGLSLQLHMSAIFLLAAGVSLQILAPWLGLARLSWRDFVYGLGALALVVAPYYIWLIAFRNGIDLGQVPPKYVGAGHFDLGTFQQSTTFALDGQGLWNLYKRLMLAWKFGDEVSLLISIPAVALAGWIGFSPIAPRAPGPLRPEEKAFRVWLVCALFALLPALTIIFTPHRSRYFTCFVFASVFAFAGWFEVQRRRLKKAPGAEMYLVCFAAVALTAFFRFARLKALEPAFIPWAWLALLPVAAGAFYWLWHSGRQRAGALLMLFFLGGFSYQARFKDTFARDNHPRLETLEAVSAAIAERTGWDWAKLRERLFLVNFHYQRSMATIYRHASAHLPAGAAATEPDGFILGLGFSAGRGEDFSSWLRKQSLPPLVREGLSSGGIELGELIPVPDGMLVPYTVRDKLAYPPRFQNVGVNYLEFSSDEVRTPALDAGAVERISPSHVRFKFNECPGFDPFCTIHFDVQRTGRELTIHFTGDVISQPSPYISPNWSQTLYRPYLRFECAGAKDAVQVRLLDQIGIVLDTIKNRNLNSVVLAPAERRLADPCAGAAARIYAGYSSSKMTRARNAEQFLPGRELSVEKF